MQNPANRLQEAMFIASESYSGSAYEIDLFSAMDEVFGSPFVIIDGTESMTPALAA